MKSQTYVTMLPVPAEASFRFLADIENLPKWATVFCQALRRENGRVRITTPEGEIFFRIDADARTGVIDMYGGPSEEQMLHWPARVIGLPSGRSAFQFTMFQWPGISDDAFAGQSQALQRELENVSRLLAAA